MSISSVLAFSVTLLGIFGKKVGRGEYSFLFWEEPDFSQL